MKQKFISICIPTYNRPIELKRLLESIDTTKVDDVDIVISENCSPKQAETRAVVEEYKLNSKYEVHYFENETNVGYDKNIRALVERATGKFCLFFSDDDLFMPDALDQFIEFVRMHQDCGYFLRSYRNYSSDMTKYQDFRYYGEDKVFPAGEKTAVDLFNKSIFLSGFTIRHDYAKNYVTDKVDGTLLYQLYLMLEVCMRYPSAYSRIIISKAVVDNGGVHYFGESDNEKDTFKSGLMRDSNILGFVKKYYEFFDFVEAHFKGDMAEQLRINFSKYSSYPCMANKLNSVCGKKEFKSFCKELEKMGMNSSYYYYIYKYALSLFGAQNCNKIIRKIKKIIGHRPKL